MIGRRFFSFFCNHGSCVPMVVTRVLASICMATPCLPRFMTTFLSQCHFVLVETPLCGPLSDCLCVSAASTQLALSLVLTTFTPKELYIGELPSPPYGVHAIDVNTLLVNTLALEVMLLFISYYHWFPSESPSTECV